jgi:rhodanese-related sulfurtransferase
VEFIQNNLGLIVLCIVSGLLVFWPAISKRSLGIKEVDTIGAVQLINHHDAVVLDVREDRELADGKIPHAVHIPVGQLSGRLHELEKFKTRPIIVNCRSGNRSMSACKLLKNNGFENVQNLAGGIGAWTQANLPVTKK